MDDPHIYISGRCHNFALALCSALKEVGVPTQILFMLRHQKDNDTQDRFGTIYSHCIVDACDDDFDVFGKNADEQWTDQFPPDQPDEDNLTSEFEYITIPFSDITLVEGVRRIRELMITHSGKDETLDVRQVSRLYEQILQSAICEGLAVSKNNDRELLSSAM